MERTSTCLSNKLAVHKVHGVLAEYFAINSRHPANTKLRIELEVLSIARKQEKSV